jgi:hypothetical protein
MIKESKERKITESLLVAATFEKANTYVFAESLIRNAEVRGSIPLCSTKFLSRKLSVCDITARYSSPFSFKPTAKL